MIFGDKSLPKDPYYDSKVVSFLFYLVYSPIIKFIDSLIIIVAIGILLLRGFFNLNNNSVLGNNFLLNLSKIQ